MTTPQEHADLAAQQTVTGELRLTAYSTTMAGFSVWGNLFTEAADTIDALHNQLAEAQRRIKELETPTMFWDFNNPEHGAYGSPYHAICDGDYDNGAELSFMTARALPTTSVRVIHDDEGNYDYEYIDAAKGV